jgi:TP901-1 family phage major tail protein
MSVGVAKSGNSFLLKIGDGASPEVFSTIGGLQGVTVKIGTESIDVTNVGSSQWRQILDGAGVRHMTISGNGIFTNDTYEQLLRTKMLNNTLCNYEVIDVDGNYFKGSFKVKDLEYKGTYKDAMQYSVSLESAGVITYTAGS